MPCAPARTAVPSAVPLLCERPALRRVWRRPCSLLRQSSAHMGTFSRDQCSVAVLETPDRLTREQSDDDGRDEGRADHEEKAVVIPGCLLESAPDPDQEAEDQRGHATD